MTNRLGLNRPEIRAGRSGPQHHPRRKHGRRPLELFTAGAFDLVITDYRMPKMDGFELIKSIRAVAPARGIILISGYAEALGMTEASTGPTRGSEERQRSGRIWVGRGEPPAAAWRPAEALQAAGLAAQSETRHRVIPL